VRRLSQLHLLGWAEWMLGAGAELARFGRLDYRGVFGVVGEGVGAEFGVGPAGAWMSPCQFHVAIAMRHSRFNGVSSLSWRVIRLSLPSYLSLPVQSSVK